MQRVYQSWYKFDKLKFYLSKLIVGIWYLKKICLITMQLLKASKEVNFKNKNIKVLTGFKFKFIFQIIHQKQANELPIRPAQYFFRQLQK